MIALHKGAPAIGPGLVRDAATTELGGSATIGQSCVALYGVCSSCAARLFLRRAFWVNN